MRLRSALVVFTLLASGAANAQQSTASSSKASSTRPSSTSSDVATAEAKRLARIEQILAELTAAQNQQMQLLARIPFALSMDLSNPYSSALNQIQVEANALNLRVLSLQAELATLQPPPSYGAMPAIPMFPMAVPMGGGMNFAPTPSPPPRVTARRDTLHCYTNWSFCKLHVCDPPRYGFPTDFSRRDACLEECDATLRRCEGE